MKKNKFMLIFFVFVFIFSFNFVNGYDVPVQNDANTNGYDNNAKNQNFGSLESLSIMLNNFQKRIGYVEVNVSNSSKENVLNVFLNLYFNSFLINVNYPLYFYYCENGFDENLITWNNVNSVLGECSNEPFYFYDVPTPLGVEKLLKVDITNFFLNDIDGIFTIKINPLQSEGGTTQLSLKSSEYSINISQRPYVEIIEIECEESWVKVNNNCEIDNTRLIEYVSNATNCSTTYSLPIDNNTYEYCNYCSHDMQLIEDDVCIFNGSAYITTQDYIDNNYFGCCAITNLPSDCPTLYLPYNQSLETLCVNKVSDFEFELDENVFFAPFVEDKVYAKIWLENLTQNYSCVSYIKILDGYNQDKKDIVQVNPTYYKNEKALFSFYTNEYEDRQHFETNKGITTIYYTKENLILDGRPYLFGVECSGSKDKKKITSEKVGYANWKYFNEPLTRLEWIKGETLGLIVGLVLLFVLMIVVGFFWLVIKR